MKYMLLIYQNPGGFEALSEEERNTVFQDVDAIMKELTDSGEWIGGDGLASSSARAWGARPRSRRAGRTPATGRWRCDR